MINLSYYYYYKDLIQDEIIIQNKIQIEIQFKNEVL